MNENKIASVLSYIFHPLLMPTYGVLILLFSETYISYTISSFGKWILISLIFTLTFVFPSLMIILMKRLKLITSVELENKEERILPFLVVLIFFYLAYRFFLEYNLPGVLFVMIFSGILIVGLTFLINFLWKISAHMMGVGGIVGALIGIQMRMPVDFLWLILISIIISGIVGFARLRLNAHTPMQVYAGFVLGMFSEWAIFALI